jgi:hypothetical protein
MGRIVRACCGLIGEIMRGCHRSARLWMCRRMGWHNADHDAKIEYDGASFKSTCEHCGKTILMDSQGNWFTIF